VAPRNSMVATADGVVHLPPCRMIDTRFEAQNGPGAPANRSVSIRDHSCGRMLIPDAGSYLVRVTNYTWSNPADPQFGRAAQAEVRTVPAAGPGVFNFAIPPGQQIAVDLEGYLLKPGAVMPPGLAGNASAGVNASPSTEGEGRMSAAVMGTRTPVANNDSGSAGSVIVDGSNAIYPTTGVLSKANAGTPYVVANIGTANSGSGFVVTNSANATMMSARGDGMILLNTNGFLNGRSEYLGTYNDAIPSDFVHGVTLAHPHDTNGGSTNRLVFFRAHSTDETGSPQTTKFEAYTYGTNEHADINFDSSVSLHKNQFHYRAFSKLENKATFWVKATTTNTMTTGTQADMFVSGNVGLGGTGTGASRLTIIDADATTGAPYRGVHLSNTVDSSVLLRTLGGGHSQLATDAAGRYLSFATGAFAERMRIDTNGNVGIGTTAPAVRLDVAGAAHITGNLTVDGSLIGGNLVARYQDLAEWVPASNDLEPGTVVVLSTTVENEVTASSKAYDTRVAGVVSTKPGILLGVGGAGQEAIATTGRVKVKVDATRQPIAIVGKALQPLASGTGEILVLLSMQ
jgi:hypothetical protein